MSGTYAPHRAVAMRLTHDYRYRLAVPGGHATCQMRIFAQDENVVCLATEHHDHFIGSFLEANSTAIATQVEHWHHPGQFGQFTWVEQDTYPGGIGPGGANETFSLVTFQRDNDGAMSTPSRHAIDRATVETMIGHTFGA